MRWRRKAIKAFHKLFARFIILHLRSVAKLLVEDSWFKEKVFQRASIWIAFVIFR